MRGGGSNLQKLLALYVVCGLFSYLINRDIDEDDYNTRNVKRQNRRTNDKIRIMEFAGDIRFPFVIICRPKIKYEEIFLQNFVILLLPYLDISFSPNKIGKPTATATPQIAKIEPNITL